MSIQGQIPFLFVAGKAFSGFILLGLALTLVHVWRRQWFPELSYGRLMI